ncbi:hypothetical protein C3L33_03428, partial [Rhododendron williamsianum]
MSPLKNVWFSVSLLVLVFVLCVRSHPDDSSVIRLPGGDEASVGGGDLCGGNEAPASCPVNCFRTDPVCGANGVTYWCGCADARCAGTRVAKLGFCEVGNGGSGSLSVPTSKHIAEVEETPKSNATGRGLLGHYGGDNSQVDSSCGVAVNHLIGMKFRMQTVDVDNSSRQMYR